MRLLLSLMPLAVGGLLLAGCAASTAGPGNATTGEEQVKAALEQQSSLQCEPGKEYWSSPGPAKRGGVLMVGSARGAAPPVEHLDPTAPGASGSQKTLYNNLIEPRACYYGDVALVPALAKAWQVSSDGLTWTFMLREDVRWHNKPPVNGRAFTSADVAWSIENQKQGGNEQSFWAKIIHREPDLQTVVLQTQEQDVDFLARLAYSANVVLPREVKEQFGDFKTVSIGTGPFMFKEFKPYVKLVLERNPTWWGGRGNDGQPLPYLDEIQNIALSDAVASLAAMRAGLLDVSDEQAGKSDADLLRRTNPKLIPFNDPSPTVWSLFFNLRKKPFDDVRVRKAFALALDGDDIVFGGFQGSGIRSGFLSTGMRDYAWSSDKAREKFKPDREKAKQLLFEAGYGPGQLRFVLESTKFYIQDAEIVQKQLEAIGVNAQILEDPGSSTIALLRKPNVELVWGALTGGSYVPDYWISGWMRTGGSLNFLGFSDSQIDVLVDAQRKEFDPAKRKQSINQIQDRLYELMPTAPIMNRIYNRFYSCRVKNMAPPHPAGSAVMAYAWLDESGC